MMARTTAEYLYHDRRAAAEERRAQTAPTSDAAEAHRNLAALHRSRRGWFEFIDAISKRAPLEGPMIDRTDKEA
jgi:hypothetical protein